MFPLSDSINPRRFPFLNAAIVIFTSYVFIKEIITVNPDLFIKTFALTPNLVNPTNPLTWAPFVTAIFLHGGFLHILSNMWFLWVFGNNVEDYFGGFRYLILYFLAGIVGNIVQFVMMPHSDIALLGASGAIAGVLGAYYVLFPYVRIKTLVFLFIFVTVIDIPAVIMLGYWFVLQLISSSSSISAATGGVAFFAHIGGFITGALFATIFRRKDILTRIN